MAETDTVDLLEAPLFGPAEMLARYKNMKCAVGGGIATVGVNRYRNSNHASPAEGGCQDAHVVSIRLHEVARDAYQRAGGQVSYVEVFMGKGLPGTIASVLETFADHADAFIARFAGRKGTPEGKCAAILADNSITWEQTLQQICDEYIGLDCNGFVCNWLRLLQPDLKIHPNRDRADEVRRRAKAYRTSLDQIEYWDLLCYVHGEHIAAIDRRSAAPGKFMVCQSAGGGPRINEFGLLKTGTRTFQLAAPTPQDVASEFYVISLW